MADSDTEKLTQVLREYVALFETYNIELAKYEQKASTVFDLVEKVETQNLLRLKETGALLQSILSSYTVMNETLTELCNKEA